MAFTPADTRPCTGTLSSANRMHMPPRLNIIRSSLVKAGVTASRLSPDFTFTAANFLLRTS